MFDKQFIAILVGPKKSGKSRLVKKIIKDKGVKDNFDYIFVLCPTLDKNDDYDFLKSTKKLKVGKSSYKTEFKTIIEESIERQGCIINEYTKQKCPNILFILDDCANTEILRPKGVVDNFALEHRHSNISFLIVGHRLQGVSAIPVSIRDQADYMFFLNPTNFQELEKIIDNNIPRMYKKDFVKRVLKIFETPFNFLMINTRKPFNKRYSEGFDDILDM
jgi:hypothetical protein